MGKKRNPNFLYLYSEALEQEIAMSKKTGVVTCADGVMYSKAEVQLIASGEVMVTIAEHRIKKIFGGEIVAYERTGSGDQRKQPAGGGTENSPHDTHPPETLPGTSGNGAVVRQGELDIF